MKHLILITLIAVNLVGFAQFDKFFHDKTLRMDYYHSGNTGEEDYYFDELIEEPYWGGSKVNLVDTFEYGKYYVKVVNTSNDSLLYSRGYSTLFGEWQTTNEASETKRSFSEAVVFPYPKQNVDVVLYSRNRDGIFEEKFRYKVNPENYFIKCDQRLVYPSFDVHISGATDKNVDILILPDGYSKEEMGLFIDDCRVFAEGLFEYAPYDKNKDKFNIRGILAPSDDSGNDIPADDVWKKTILNTSFYTFDSERYCMTIDNKSVRDLAANAPYDQIYILVNNKKYGGGAIYNYYNVSVNSNEKSSEIFIHELGHGFVGLADEYYNSSTSYNDFYNLNAEPWESNITTLIDFDSKWKDMVKKRIPIPTPDTEKYKNKVGVFEGGGFVAKGVYRPMHDCMMKSFGGDSFCPVCSKAIQNMINFYSE
ncbi:MAG: peptidase M64 [Bacteroidetes bacterium]|nr:peptidase M64 [Bacteroidota bacterium]MBL6943158.1 peptidase M64 [Bacteroidales bacterium]